MPTITTSHSGDRLKIARIKAGYLTAKDFYEKFNIKASTYSAHESGRNPLSVKTAQQYGELLNTSFSWLLTGEETNHEDVEKYLLHYGQVPRDILLNKMLNEVTTQFIKSAGIQRGMTVAEFGCGTGSMSCWLAEFVGESGHVYAIDKGYEQLSITKKRAEALNIRNIEYIRTEISHTPLKLMADLVYMRCFLHHVKNPEKVIEMAINLLPPGGTIVCMEPILSSFWAYPDSAEMRKAVNLYIKLGQKYGLDFDIGTKLYHHLFNTNLLTSFQSFAHHGVGTSKFEKSWIEMITAECAIKYVEEGLATEKDMDNIISKISHHIEMENTIATLPQFVCITAKKH